MKESHGERRLTNSEESVKKKKPLIAQCNWRQSNASMDIRIKKGDDCSKYDESILKQLRANNVIN